MKSSQIKANLDSAENAVEANRWPCSLANGILGGCGSGSTSHPRLMQHCALPLPPRGAFDLSQRDMLLVVAASAAWATEHI